MDLSKYKSLYVSETQENLETLGKLLVALEADGSQRDAIDTVFRLFHSVKGMSGTMGYTPLCELAHQLEDLMDAVRKGHHALDPATVDTLLAGVDRMSQWLADVEADKPLVQDPAADRLTQRVAELLGRLPGRSQPPRSQPPRSQPPRSQPPRSQPPRSQPPSPAAPPVTQGDLRVEVRPKPDTPDPGLRAFLLVRKLEALGEVRWSTPGLDTLRSGQLSGALQLLIHSAHAAEKVEAFIRLMPDWAEVKVRLATAAPVAEDPDGSEERGLVGDPELLGALEGLDFDFESAFEPGDSVERPLEPALALRALDPDDRDLREAQPSRPPAGVRPQRDRLALVPPPLTSRPPRPVDPAEQVSLPLEHPSEASATAALVRARRASARTIRVKTRWIDDLLDRVSDLLIVAQRLWTLNQQAPRPALSEGLGELSRLLELLHGQALTARLTSFSVLTERLPRVVRDLARQADKRATLVVRGADEQVDRAIIEGLDAPLTHLLRNAIEHGIELPAERAGANKPATGVLTLACLRIRDEIVIELGDDGRGIDRRAIVERAVELRLLERSAAERAVERDLRRILCLPGFTTHQRAGALAGRGVGMDAVYEQITELGGMLEIHSEPAVGTLVRLRLPRSPGIGKLLLVQAGGQTFGLPLGRVVRTASFERGQVRQDAQGARRVPYQDEPHRLLTLQAVLGFGEAELPERFPAVILRLGRDEVVLAVERLVGQQDAVVKPLGPLLERIEGLSGVTLDAVGQPVFVVDLSRAPDPS